MREARDPTRSHSLSAQGLLRDLPHAPSCHCLPASLRQPPASPALTAPPPDLCLGPKLRTLRQMNISLLPPASTARSTVRSTAHHESPAIGTSSPLTEASPFLFHGPEGSCIAQGQAQPIARGTKDTLAQRIAETWAATSGQGMIGGALPFESGAQDCLWHSPQASTIWPDALRAQPAEESLGGRAAGRAGEGGEPRMLDSPESPRTHSRARCCGVRHRGLPRSSPYLRCMPRRRGAGEAATVVRPVQRPVASGARSTSPRQEPLSKPLCSMRSLKLRRSRSI